MYYPSVSRRTNNIIGTIEALRARGTEFLDIPNAYYTELKKRLASSKVQVKEDLEKLQKLKILIDYDEEGYLLQVHQDLYEALDEQASSPKI